MGRKSLNKSRKAVNEKVTAWLEKLLINLQHENLASLTIDDLARLAGKSKSTIYMYFKTKEEILLAACKTRVDYLSMEILSILNQETDIKTSYLSLMHKFAEGNTDITISFIQSIKKHYPKAWTVVEEFTNRFIEIIKEHYKLGIHEGVFNKFSVDLASELDKIFIMQVVNNTELFKDNYYSVSQLINDYLELRLVGVLKKEY